MITKTQTGAASKPTFHKTADNTAASLASSDYLNGALEPTACFITVEDNACRVAFGGATASNSTPLGHLINPGESLRLESISHIKTLSYVNAVDDADAVLVFTLEF